MNPITLLVLGAVGGWLAYKWLNKPEDKLDKKSSDRRPPVDQPPKRNAEELVQDPDTGVFKPRDE